MTTVNVYEQELFGETHYRVMRADGQLIFGRITTDFPTEHEAVNSVVWEFHRNKLGPVKIVVTDRQCRMRVTAA